VRSCCVVVVMVLCMNQIPFIKGASLIIMS
jgi:hypothetical protein